MYATKMVYSTTNADNGRSAGCGRCIRSGFVFCSRDFYKNVDTWADFTKETTGKKCTDGVITTTFGAITTE